MKKLCPTCERIKDTKEFYSNAAQKDKLSVSCKVCQKDFVKEHYKNNKEYSIAWVSLNNKRKKNLISKKEFKEKVSQLKSKYKGV